MKFQKFSKVFNTIVRIREDQQKYLESIPQDIRDSFFDNHYSNMDSVVIEHLLLQFIGKDLKDEIFWFLYEWKKGYSIITDNDEREYEINTHQDMLNYIEKEYFRKGKYRALDN